MKHLYLTLLELLKEIPEIRFVDLNLNQLMSEKPALSYPAILITMDLPQTENIGTYEQNVECIFTLRLITKRLDAHNLTPRVRLNTALEYLGLQEKIYDILQGYNNKQLEPFERISVKNENIRPELNVIAINFATGWREDSANS